MLGIPLGLTSLFPKLLSENNGLQLVYSYLKFYLSRILILTSALTVLFLILSGELSTLLVESSDYYFVLFIILLSAPFAVGYSLVEPLLKAKGEIKKIVKISVISNIVPFIILIPLVIYCGVNGVSYYLLLYGIFPFLLYILFFNRKFVSDLISAKDILDTQKKKSIVKIGIVSLLSSFLFQFSIIYIRKFSISEFGIENTGIYQSLLSLSTNYFTLIYVFLANYSLPKLSSFAESNDITDEINNNFRLLLFIVIPVLTIVFCYRDFIIEIIFSSSFTDASNYIIFQLIGDFFRAFAALFGLWLIPKEKLAIIITIDCIMNFLLLSLPYVFHRYFGFGIESLPMAYLVSFFAHCSFYFLYTRKNLNFRFTKQNLRSILFSLSALSTAFILSGFLKSWGYYIAPLILITWVFFFLEAQERKSVTAKIISFLPKFNR